MPRIRSPPITLARFLLLLGLTKPVFDQDTRFSSQMSRRAARDPRLRTYRTCRNLCKRAKQTRQLDSRPRVPLTHPKPKTRAGGFRLDFAEARFRRAKRLTSRRRKSRRTGRKISNLDAAARPERRKTFPASTDPSADCANEFLPGHFLRRGTVPVARHGGRGACVWVKREAANRRQAAGFAQQDEPGPRVLLSASLFFPCALSFSLGRGQ